MAGGGWLDQVEIRLSQLSTKLKLKLKLKLSLATTNIPKYSRVVDDGERTPIQARNRLSIFQDRIPKQIVENYLQMSGIAELGNKGTG